MKRPIYAALDLHSRYSVLGSMDHDGQTQPRMRFPTEANILRVEVVERCSKDEARNFRHWKLKAASYQACDRQYENLSQRIKSLFTSGNSVSFRSQSFSQFHLHLARSIEGHWV
jgi:hypothetical protein